MSEIGRAERNGHSTATDFEVEVGLLAVLDGVRIRPGGKRQVKGNAALPPDER